MDHMERRKKIQTCAIAALAFGAGCNLRTQLNFFPFGPCDPNNHFGRRERSRESLSWLQIQFNALEVQKNLTIVV